MEPLYVDDQNSALLTDLYEITMAAAYWSNQMADEVAAFELYFRRLPRDRSYVIAAGLEQALHYINNVHFSAESIDYLKSLEQFQKIDPGFWEYLLSFRFTGSVRAVPEGTPVFPLEPILQIRAPLIEAQILETYLLTVINMQSLIATKAARIVRAAKGRGVIDFGARRAHGPQAGVYAARAAYAAGCIGTSNLLAGKLCNIPVFGTAAHSFTMAFPSELSAFRAYQNVFPDNTVLLIDTYDTLQAARKVKDVSFNVKGVRLDSGDLLELSKNVRRILDNDGLQHVKIFLSGDLNEYKIEELLKNDAQVDFFGVGTELVTSYDDPALSGVYKIVEAIVDGKPRPLIKVSPGKKSYPGLKQVFRFNKDQFYERDLIGLLHDSQPEGSSPLLQEYIAGGNLVRSLPSLSETRDHALRELDRLPPELHTLQGESPYNVELSESVQELFRQSSQAIL